MGDERKRMKMWQVDVPADEECPVSHVSISNTGHVIIKFKSPHGRLIMRELSDGIEGQNVLSIPFMLGTEILVVQVQDLEDA